MFYTVSIEKWLRKQMLPEPLAEVKRFELLRRFEADLPHFECVRNFRTWRNLTEAEGSCGNPKKPEFPRVLRRQKRKKRGNT